MRERADGPGYANLEELCAYWRMASLRATRELARALGVIKVGNCYPWLSIWAAEGLAPPSPRYWSDLKHPHLTAKLLAGVLGQSERSARRRDLAKPDASFPDPVPIRPKPKLWRAVSVMAWATGLPVPNFKLQTRKCPRLAAGRDDDPEGISTAVFDPWRNS